MSLDLTRYYFNDDNTEGFDQKTLDAMNSELTIKLEELADELFSKSPESDACENEDEEDFLKEILLGDYASLWHVKDLIIKRYE